jgi:hypothetical protein
MTPALTTLYGDVTGGAVSGSSFKLTGTYPDICGHTNTATITGQCGTNQQIALESTGYITRFTGTGNVTCLGVGQPPTQTTNNFSYRW